VRVMTGMFASDSMRIIVAPVEASDADRVLFAAAETGDGQAMGQVFFHVLRVNGEPRVRMARLPGGVATAPGLYAAIDAIGPIAVGGLDVTGDLLPTFNAANDSLTLQTPAPFPTYAGGAIVMESTFTFGPAGMTMAERGLDSNGEAVWTFPEGEGAPLERRGPTPVAERRESGLRVFIVKEGDESAPIGAKGDSYTVHYTGWLPSGEMFDSSKQPGRQPFTITIPGGVIQGWNEGLVGMRVGETRRLFIPPALGYGERGAGGVIPPNSWLVFDVELLDVKKPGEAPATPAPAQQGGVDHDHDGDGHPDH
jgi:hypothetical protein